MSWQADYFDRFYRRKPGWVDGTTQFHELCRRFIIPESTVLEVGAGPANPTSEFLSKSAAHVVGLDVDEAVKQNRFLSEARVYDGRTFPFEDGAFDAAVSDYAMEHTENPSTVLREINRVLKPGGAFLLRTPNVFHYVSILSRVFPDRLSTWARNREDTHPVYPKFFRFNSAHRCRRLLEDAGFDIADMVLIEKEPSYGMKSRLLFFPMLAYERLVNSSNVLAILRANILCATRKVRPGAVPSSH